ncbi:anaerobic sulfite reductase subunit A [Clostridium acetobutylicum]|uniref:Anaerobic sulfite reductase (Fe-S subunit) n=1 Tax=Clostridium acetobutylicum (strain ATCC 824 / DSM 792 / JCM 1419 / IAM 19013 / LMG 5710 / NBRC 13948 / NRRL B-527 / VKM B-1787 / 2291 / W) TaxID=272562 RepID=Q97IX7_CLOAB|nr:MULTISPECIES: anaerobic sulfite reductase subunit AsrA [Clostridium]AAK79480.1 Anaerobic sulfite reductase (Fe-S subunit) [Clostridium acetobutylicum ATCC 824]ADZ20565.1 Anaerobic sulfite reductase (Fe-S subunit) [Clostridium acetobutylicum EA 2018]AEI34042.1 anaerobic sulfite reductase (Fe-S subunit) [Clostridium acetobutylicum DSM 1731]AWV81275.1 anaerobic sulfite reductase subunit A [Clostridium acetobutylicum]MBC2392909.1 anaerobic sulfite reductase subunit A [Clostridium acetobutylicum
MGYRLTRENLNTLFHKLKEDYLIYAPKRLIGKGAFSDTDRVRYDKINNVEEIEFDVKSDFSFKEILLPISETLFFFTEDSVKEAEGPKKGAIIFLRSCDINAVKRLDQIYLKNGFEDHYYKRIREKVKFVLMPCKTSFENCFCVSMGTNQADMYDASVELREEHFYIDNKEEKWKEFLKEVSLEELEVKPSFVMENKTKVKVPEGITTKIFKSKMWDEYDSRCINCGRCNFVCPTCTCFSMQDIFYTDNGKAGERRRVWASCMVDGFTNVAGGGSYRSKNGQRMRFKVMHKVYDYKKRNGYHMCVGCGRCDDICPEYISFSNCINKLKGAIKEVEDNE